jgi:hypothetical protein
MYTGPTEGKLLFLEDAGDTMLEGAVQAARAEEDVLPLYEQCVEILVGSVRGHPGARREGDPAAALLRRREIHRGDRLLLPPRRAGIRRDPAVRREERAMGIFLPFLRQLLLAATGITTAAT